jgi:hypothetical protein
MGSTNVDLRLPYVEQLAFLVVTAGGVSRSDFFPSSENGVLYLKN